MEESEAKANIAQEINALFAGFLKLLIYKQIHLLLC